MSLCRHATSVNKAMAMLFEMSVPQPISWWQGNPWDLSLDIHRQKGGVVASWLVRSSPDPAVRVRSLAGDIVLCSWARHYTLTVPLSTQVYKWVPANLMLGVTLRWTSIPSRGE